ncbi:MAG: hypothetical protein M1840_006598 [Geoglossum simile]|nr:MAG: hypothetical protein M1840_006598 [Geoglossum simile]
MKVKPNQDKIEDQPQGVAERSVGVSRQIMHCSVESLGGSSSFAFCDWTSSACCLLKSVVKLLSSSISSKSTSSTVPSVFGVYSGLGASVALIRFGDEPADWAANDLFLDAVGLAEGPDWGGAVRSTTVDADEEGLAEEWRDERRSTFVMTDVAAGERGADREVCLGEGEVAGDVESVVSVNGAEGGAAEEKKDETKPINGAAWEFAMAGGSEYGRWWQVEAAEQPSRRLWKGLETHASRGGGRGGGSW